MDPKTDQQLYSGCGRECLHFQTETLPSLGEVLDLCMPIKVGPKKYSQDFRLKFRVVEVSRFRYCSLPQRVSGTQTIVLEGAEHFWLKVVPITKKFDGTIRLVKKFHKQLSQSPK
jgi:hypothetical protein